MKVYRFGNEGICYNIIIEEDNGEIRVAFVGLKRVEESIAKPTYHKNGIVRLTYGNGSSMPYKGENGKLCEKYTLIYEN